MMSKWFGDTFTRRASADYRRHIVSGLFKEVLETAWGRALEIL